MMEFPTLSALFIDCLPFALLGGILGLDMVSFPQIMISRPLVSATIACAVAGRGSEQAAFGDRLHPPAVAANTVHSPTHRSG